MVQVATPQPRKSPSVVHMSASRARLCLFLPESLPRQVFRSPREDSGCRLRADPRKTGRLRTFAPFVLALHAGLRLGLGVGSVPDKLLGLVAAAGAIAEPDGAEDQDQYQRQQRHRP